MRVGVAALAAVVLAGCGSDPPPPAPAAPVPKVLRIVFPEGFTRAQMVVRVGAVREIARVRRHVTMRMTPSTYAAATAAAPIPAPFRTDAHEQIEGFLFPATYAFFSNERAQRFVGRQLVAFRKAWRRVDMRYARSKNLTPYDVLIIASMVEREVVAPREQHRAETRGECGGRAPGWRRPSGSRSLFDDVGVRRRRLHHCYHAPGVRADLDGDRVP